MTGIFRSYSAVLFLLLCAGVNPGSCQDFLVARVESVDLERMEFEASPLHQKKFSAQEFETQRIHVQAAVQNNLPQHNGITAFPGCVIAGDTVRLWGEYSRGNARSFLVTDIRGCRGGGCLDPTGVRSRLQRGRGSTHRDHLDESSRRESDADGVGFGGEGSGRGGSCSGGGFGGGGGGR